MTNTYNRRDSLMVPTLLLIRRYHARAYPNIPVPLFRISLPPNRPHFMQKFRTFRQLECFAQPQKALGKDRSTSTCTPPLMVNLASRLHSTLSHNQQAYYALPFHLACYLLNCSYVLSTSATTQRSSGLCKHPLLHALRLKSSFGLIQMRGTALMGCGYIMEDTLATQSTTQTSLPTLSSLTSISNI